MFFLQIQQLAHDPKKSLRRSLSGENWPEMPGLGLDKNHDDKSRPGSKLSQYGGGSRPGSAMASYDDNLFSDGPKTENGSASNNNRTIQPQNAANSSGNNDEMTAIAHIKDTLQETLKICSPLNSENANSNNQEHQYNNYNSTFFWW